MVTHHADNGQLHAHPLTTQNKALDEHAELYYFIANVAAFTQTQGNRRYPKVLQIVGALGCLILVATLPPTSISIGVGVFVIGILGRLIILRRRRTAS